MGGGAHRHVIYVPSVKKQYKRVALAPPPPPPNQKSGGAHVPLASDIYIYIVVIKTNSVLFSAVQWQVETSSKPWHILKDSMHKYPATTPFVCLIKDHTTRCPRQTAGIDSSVCEQDNVFEHQVYKSSTITTAVVL